MHFALQHLTVTQARRARNIMDYWAERGEFGIKFTVDAGGYLRSDMINGYPRSTYEKVMSGKLQPKTNAVKKEKGGKHGKAKA